MQGWPLASTYNQIQEHLKAHVLIQNSHEYAKYLINTSLSVLVRLCFIYIRLNKIHYKD